MNNPLLNHYRRSSSISIQLPSGGFYGGDIDFNMNKEVEIFPLSVKNEIYINNPDHLLSGEACKYSIEQCCPNIKDINNLPYMDMEAICLGIKKSSYGNELKLPYKCPECKHEDTAHYSIDFIFSQMKFLPEHFICEIDDLKIYLKPYPLEKFDQFKLIYTNESIAENALRNSELSKEEIASIIYESIEKISNISTEAVADCIIRIELKDGIEVTDQNMIKEYFDNAPLYVTKEIIKKHSEFNSYGLEKEVTLTCNKCNHDFKYPLTFDPSSFFE